MKIIFPFMIVLAGCGSARGRSEEASANNVGGVSRADLRQSDQRPKGSAGTGKTFPQKYMRAFTCDFDENPLAAYERTHGTPAGRVERAADLTLLRSLGFAREGRNGHQESLAGKIAAPPGLTILGLPVQSLEINGMVGDPNAMYVTTFDKGVAVDQIVKAARVELDRASFEKYNTRYYSRRIGNNPYTEISLNDRGGGNAVLICRIQSTPD